MMAQTSRSLWKQIQLSKDIISHFAVKTCTQNNSYEFKLTDYMRLWSETISFKDMSLRFENQNPGMEIEGEELPKVIDEALSNHGSELHLEMSDDKSSLKFVASFESYGMKMNWIFECTEGNPERVYQQLFGPVFSSVLYLLHEREYLIKMVADKDAALEKLRKAEDKTIKRKYVSFDQKEFEESTLKEYDDMSDGMKCNNFFGTPYQCILSHFEKHFEKLAGRPTIRENDSKKQISGVGQNDDDKNNENQKQVAMDTISPSKSEKEEEEERRMELEKRLAEKKAGKKKKVLKF